MVASLTAAHSEDLRPPFQKLRYNENYGFLADPAQRTDWLDPIKYLSLDAGGGWYLSLGGEIRERYSYTHDPVWGAAPQDKNGLLLQRYILHGDLHLGPRFRIFGQFYSALEDGRAGVPRATDENRLDLQQLFGDAVLPFTVADISSTIRFGRQELIYGSSRLVDAREGPNVRRKFDGARILSAHGDWRADLIAVRLSEINTGAFDDGLDDAEELWGLYAVSPPSWIAKLSSIDLYYLGYQGKRTTYAQGSAGETRHTFGMRLWGQRDGFDWNWEGIYQWGSFGHGDISAWSLGTDTGHTWREVPWKPRLGISANIASGDKDPTDRDLQTLNPLFPRGNYFSELGLLGPQNFFNAHPFLTVQPRADLTLTADIDFYWRLRRSDGVYGPGRNVIRSGLDSNARYVGTELSFNATWQVTRHITLTAIYSHFFPGQFVVETGPSKDIDFVELTFKFLF